MLLTTGMLLVSGCLSVPIEQSHQELEAQATAAIPGSERLPRRTARDGDPGSQVQALLADELTAEAAVRVALWNNPRIQSHYARLDRAAAERLAARLLRNPQVHGAVIFSEEDSSEEVIELGAEIDLLHLILLSKRSRIGAARYEAVKLDVARAVQQLAYDTRLACYRLLAAQQRLALRESVLQAADAARDMAQRLRDAGNIKELDKLNREALHEQAALGVSAAALAVEEQREHLNMLMGLSGADTRWWMAGELPAPGNNAVLLGEVVDQALQNSVQLEMTRWQIEAAAQALGIARAESVIPTLQVGIDAEREHDGVWLVGPMIAVELPLFDFGQARRPAAEAALKRLHHEYAALAIDIAATARRAAKRAEVASYRVRRYRETLLPLREDITQRTQLQYNAMQLGVFQLLQAKQMEIAENSAYIDELLNYWIARTEIEQIRRGLLVDSRATVNAPADAPMAGGKGGGH
ncbi:MAG: TolC family protein [Candidatus Marinimicrobia bacterium]|nr:TolC family protein [Candidatus Neomarinimicrobiota bacterium]